MCVESIQGPLVVAITITLTMNMEAELMQLFNPFEVSNPFGAKIQLHMNTRLEVTKVITPFLDLLRSFDAKYVHNMMAIMLDPHFKALWIVEGLVGCGNAIKLAFEYDAKVVILLLMV
jgi:hypothetical protein